MALDHELHFTALGGSRPPLEASPCGPGLGRQSFLPWLEPLAGARRLVLLDPRGCGESPVGDEDSELNQAARRVFPLELVRSEPEQVARMLDGFGLRLAPFRRGLESLAGWSVTERLGQLPVPTLVVAGAEDWFLPPAQSASPFAALPDVEVAIFEQCGHLAFVDQPERFVAIVADWMARRCPAEPQA